MIISEDGSTQLMHSLFFLPAVSDRLLLFLVKVYLFDNKIQHPGKIKRKI